MGTFTPLPCSGQHQNHHVHCAKKPPQKNTWLSYPNAIVPFFYNHPHLIALCSHWSLSKRDDGATAGFRKSEAAPIVCEMQVELFFKTVSSLKKLKNTLICVGKSNWPSWGENQDCPSIWCGDYLPCGCQAGEKVFQFSLICLRSVHTEVYRCN